MVKTLEHSTREGELITMRRAEDRSAPGYDQGWVTFRVSAFVGQGSEERGHLSISWIPDFDERYADMKAYRSSFGRPNATENDRTKTKAFHGEPFVAAVKVNPSHWRRHIGIALYREAALWLAQDWDLRLRSGDPNPSAEALWAKLQILGEPVTTVDILLNYQRFALDYRKTGPLLGFEPS